MCLGEKKATWYSYSQANTERQRTEKFKKDGVTTEYDLWFLGTR